MSWLRGNRKKVRLTEAGIEQFWGENITFECIQGPNMEGWKSRYQGVCTSLGAILVTEWVIVKFLNVT
jgi:hypothetical protein